MEVVIVDFSLYIVMFAGGCPRTGIWGQRVLLYPIITKKKQCWVSLVIYDLAR